MANTMTLGDHAQRIFDSLASAKTTYKLRLAKEHWLGYILALIDMGQIIPREYQWLLRCIDAWHLGDTKPRFSPPTPSQPDT